MQQLYTITINYMLYMLKGASFQGRWPWFQALALPRAPWVLATASPGHRSAMIHYDPPSSCLLIQQATDRASSSWYSDLILPMTQRISISANAWHSQITILSLSFTHSQKHGLLGSVQIVVKQVNKPHLEALQAWTRTPKLLVPLRSPIHEPLLPPKTRTCFNVKLIVDHPFGIF